MLALGTANVVAAVLFAAVYGVAGMRYLSQGGFLACLLLIFAMATLVWVRAESRHMPLGFVRRLGRAAGGLMLVLAGVPIAVLMPLFWLETVLPPEAEFARVLAPTMTLTLIALTFVVLMNVVGVAVQGARGLGRRPGRRAPS